MSDAGLRTPPIAGLPGPEALGRLAYVVGPVRGGTTLLYQAIGLHPEILTFRGMTHFVNHVWQYRNKVHERLLRILVKLPNFCKQEKDILARLGEAERLEWKRFTNRAVKRKRMAELWSLYPMLYALTPLFTKRAEDIRCWCEKSNDCAGIADIARDFPWSRFLFIARDPLASVSSMAVRSADKAGEANPQVQFDKLLASAVHWAHMTLRMLRFARRHPGQSRLLRFEDLVQDPVATLSGAFAFLEVAPLPADQLAEAVGKLSYRATNAPGESGSGMDTRPLERWRSVLSEPDAAVIRDVTGRIARCAGYEVPGSLTLGKALGLALRVQGLRGRVLTLGKLVWIAGFSLLRAGWTPARGRAA